MLHTRFCDVAHKVSENPLNNFMRLLDHYHPLSTTTSDLYLLEYLYSNPYLSWRESGRIWPLAAPYVCVLGRFVMFSKLVLYFCSNASSPHSRDHATPLVNCGKNGTGVRNQDSFYTLSSSDSLSHHLCNKCTSLSLPEIMKTKLCLCILIPPIIPWAKYRARDLSDLLWYSVGIRWPSAGLMH